MDIFEADEQQREEELQKWWHDNWLSIVTGIVVAFILIFGFHKYREYEKNQKIESTQAFYTEVVQNDGSDDASIAKVKSFIDNHKNDSLGVLAAIQLSKTYVSLGKYEEAYNLLDAAKAQGSDDILQNLVAIRCARLAIELKKFDKVEAILSSLKDDTYFAIKNEILGDMAYAQGDNTKAYEFYKQALKNENQSQFIRVDFVKQKLNAITFTEGAADTLTVKEVATDTVDAQKEQVATQEQTTQEASEKTSEEK